ncbi:hypothetical protein LUZ60_011454 [Juncus effusus]|nr:hypothetical protein LUZ60_011454 [Juncus effusus]
MSFLIILLQPIRSSSIIRSLRTSIECAFGALKNRFKILICRPYFPYSTQVDLVLICCTIHNYILEYGLDSFVPTIEECQTTNSRGPTTSESRDRTRDGTREWVTLRDYIMNQIWERDGR